MNFKNTFKKSIVHSSKKDFWKSKNEPEVPAGLLKKCNSCKSAVFTEDVNENYYICPKCNYYFRMHAFRRIEMIVDENTFEQWDTGLESPNPLNYRGYEEKLAAMKEKTHLDEAVVTGKATIAGKAVALGICDSRFIMASMGEVVGEKIARMVERATEEHMPIIMFACSGGARMQEGITSLMQMAKTSAALKRHSEAGLLYISILTNPTTGGVTASFAMLGDIILAEPGALIGFAGPRVIEQTIGQKLPKGFQTSEFLLEHGFIDAIIERQNMKETLIHLLNLHDNSFAQENIFTNEKNIVNNRREVNEVGIVPIDKIESLSAWDRVERSRLKNRPVSSEYIQKLFHGFYELHGDRCYKDDKALVGGIAYFHNIPVTVIAQEKGTTTKENIERNFGMPSPDGYRKALRLMKQAEKFHRPVICIVDTPGAFCGIEAEERGQGEAIAKNISEMSGLKTPVVSLIIGEGGSGGALALATSDEVWMLENSIYSILSPEGFASILWKDSKRAKEAAEIMKLTAEDLKKNGIVEHVFSEPKNYSSETMHLVCENIDKRLNTFIEHYSNLSLEDLLEHRYQRFRKM